MLRLISSMGSRLKLKPNLTTYERIRYLAVLRIVLQLRFEPVQRSYPEKVHLAVDRLSDRIL